MALGERALRPSDAIEQPDGTFKRPVVRFTPDGKEYPDLRTCCERCWESVPNYVDAPFGYVSPDSGRKLKAGMVEGHASVEARQKIVCYDCYKGDALDMFGVFADFPHALRE